MKCPNCGQELETDDDFYYWCPKCDYEYEK